MVLFDGKFVPEPALEVVDKDLPAFWVLKLLSPILSQILMLFRPLQLIFQGVSPDQTFLSESKIKIRPIGRIIFCDCLALCGSLKSLVSNSQHLVNLGDHPRSTLNI